MRYEEPYERKKAPRRARQRRRSFGAWLAGACLKLLALALTLALVGAGILYALPPSLFAVEPEGVELSLTDGLPQDRANILLLGLDALRESRQRSDAILIASVTYGDVRLASVLRDTVVNIPGHNSGKLNAAYANGGPALVMRTLNENFKLNLMHYAAVDYTALVNVVDALGGVTLNVSEAEVAAINRILEANWDKLTALGYAPKRLERGGEGTRLDGAQALAFARIRKIDSDFGRTGRQRRLLLAMLERVKASWWNPVRMAKLLRALFTSIDTNMSPVQLLSLGMKALTAEAPTQLRLPVDGSYTDDGASLKIDDWDANVGALQGFLYE